MSIERNSSPSRPTRKTASRATCCDLHPRVRYWLANPLPPLGIRPADLRTGCHWFPDPTLPSIAAFFFNALERLLCAPSHFPAACVGVRCAPVSDRGLTHARVTHCDRGSAHGVSGWSYSPTADRVVPPSVCRGCWQLMPLHVEQRPAEPSPTKRRVRPSPRRLGRLIGDRRRPRGGFYSASTFLAHGLCGLSEGCQPSAGAAYEGMQSGALVRADDACVLCGASHEPLALQSCRCVPAMHTIRDVTCM